MILSSFAAYRGRICVRLLAVLATAWLGTAHPAEQYKNGGPYVPTPQVVVDRMLLMAETRSGDYVIDLGSGDGVIVLTAARMFGAQGLGVDIDPELVRRSNDAARKFGIADRVHFLQQDVFKTDLSKASIVTLYLLPHMMLSLRERIFNELKPGARVVSHDYHFGDWMPDEQFTFEVAEKQQVHGRPEATVYLWHMPARIAGRWEVRVAGRGNYELALKQRFQDVEGSVTAGGNALRPQAFELRGTEFSFVLPDGNGVARFTGRVKGNAMDGTVELPGAMIPARWSAVRIAAGRATTE